MTKREPLKFRDKFLAAQRADGHCAYCGEPLSCLVEGGADTTFDHIIPVTRGGTNEPKNLIAACRNCNSAKRAKTAFEFFCEMEGMTVPLLTRLNPELGDVFESDEASADATSWRDCWRDEFYEGQCIDWVLDIRAEDGLSKRAMAFLKINSVRS